MTREEIMQMGRQAGSFIELAQEKDLLWLERFAALVAKHTLANIDPSSFMTWQEGYEVGKQTEREACAWVCDSLEEQCEKLLVPDEKWPTPSDCANIIRARRNHDTR